MLFFLVFNRERQKAVKIFELTGHRQEGGPGWSESSKIQRTGFLAFFIWKI